MSDNVNHPKHYENGPFECIELTRLLSFDWGNVVKYCYRWQSKNGVEDLRKAFWYAKDATMRGCSSTAIWIAPARTRGHCLSILPKSTGLDCRTFGRLWRSGHGRKC